MVVDLIRLEMFQFEQDFVDLLEIFFWNVVDFVDRQEMVIEEFMYCIMYFLVGNS